MSRKVCYPLSWSVLKCGLYTSALECEGMLCFMSFAAFRASVDTIAAMPPSPEYHLTTDLLLCWSAHALPFMNCYCTVSLDVMRCRPTQNFATRNSKRYPLYGASSSTFSINFCILFSALLATLFD